MNRTTAYKFNSFYDFIFYELGDRRTESWFLISDPVPGLSILTLYWYFVFKFGRKFMENREPFKLTKILFLFNSLQVLANIWIFQEGCKAGWLTTYSWRCQPVDFSNSPQALRMANAVYVYFLIKLSELFDTVFFILRKKYNQITFLHVYHHSIMLVTAWGCTKYYPGGHGTFIGMINSLVHIVMYTYYLLSSLGPQWQKYLWWKKYITTMQLAQFCIFFLHFVQLFFYDCGYPRWTAYLVLPNVVFFYYLFMDFYKKAYGLEKNSKEKSKKKTDLLKSH